MQSNILSRARRVGDARVAAVFSDPLRRRLVLLLAHQERSVGELADVTGLGLKRLHYHVTALRKLGLLLVVRERQRAGRAIKIYRAVADAFFVPEKVMPSRPGAALTVELRELLDKVRDGSRDGAIYYLGEDGEPRMRPVTNVKGKPGGAAEYWRVVKLSRADAIRLTKNINDCLEAFERRPSDAFETYLVHFAFARRRLRTTR